MTKEPLREMFKVQEETFRKIFFTGNKIQSLDKIS